MRALSSYVLFYFLLLSALSQCSCKALVKLLYNKAFGVSALTVNPANDIVYAVCDYDLNDHGSNIVSINGTELSARHVYGHQRLSALSRLRPRHVLV